MGHRLQDIRCSPDIKTQGQGGCLGGNIHCPVTRMLSFHGEYFFVRIERYYFILIRYGKKYFGSRLEQADTGPWRKIRERERREEERERF